MPKVETPEFVRDFMRAFEERASQSSESSEGGEGQEGGAPEPGPPRGAGAAAAALAASIFGNDVSDQPDQETSKARAPPSSTEELMLLTRKLIEVRNILKSIDHESEQLKLPSIVVIGSQSSGKSSVLEAIVGHEFLPK